MNARVYVEPISIPIQGFPFPSSGKFLTSSSTNGKGTLLFAEAASGLLLLAGTAFSLENVSLLTSF